MNESISTQRLIIRQLEETDWKSMIEIFRDFEGSEYRNYDFPLPTEVEPVRALAAQWAAEGKYYAVVLADGGESVGYICYHGTDVPDIGFAMKRRFQRRGYAFEAVKAWMNDSGFERFTAGVALDNTPSVKLIRKLGFQLVKTETMSFRKDERGNDLICECGVFEYGKSSRNDA